MSDTKKGVVVSTRFTASDFTVWASIAERDGQTLSEYIRDAAMREAERRRIAITWHSNSPLVTVNVA